MSDREDFEKAAQQAGLSTAISHIINNKPVYMNVNTKAAYNVWQASSASRQRRFMMRQNAFENSQSLTENRFIQLA